MPVIGLLATGARNWGQKFAEHAAVGLALSIERGFPHHIAQNTTVIHGKALPHRTAFAASSR